ncbi:MAG: hypothetical protein Q8L79_07695 [Methylobacter sp.]|uniref:hypothetical protein n=1 Tax=Methylobacter sp. TaxID=2051955 RepID=UPI002731D3AD|nr:hypothetical protein [Methylobacter sp.]MDP1664996.1 hypothetical protein [Methylobacter sp.]
MKETLQKLMMSSTLMQLHQLSQTLPVNVHNHEDLLGAFATCSTEIIGALDAGRIHFDNDKDHAMLLGLLTVITDYAMDGRLKTAFGEEAIH